MRMRLGRTRDWIRALLGLLWLLMLTMGQAAPAAGGARAGAPLILDVWTTEEGLPQNEVTAIVQTRDGYLWLGTYSGLVRFDGSRFTVFDEGNTPGLKSSRISNLFEDREGRLWIGTENAGMAIMDHGRVAGLGFGPTGRESRPTAICQDGGGAVWLCLANGQLWRWELGKTNLFTVPSDVATDYRGIAAEPGGPLWFGTDRSLLGIDWRSAAVATNLPTSQNLTLEKLDFVLASRAGGCWRLANRLVQKWTDGRDRPDVDLGWYPWGLQASGQRLARVSAVCEDLSGNLIVGTQGAGVYWFDSTGEFTQISTNSGLSNDFILSLHVDRDGDLWVGTDGGGLNRVKKPLFEVMDSSRGLVAQAVSADANDGLWIAYNGRPLTYWRDGVQRQVGFVRTVFVDREQRVWAGTWGARLLQVQGQAFKEVPGFEKPIHVAVIHQDRRGWIWAGGREGLARWDGERWIHYSRRDGLSSDQVQAVADDANGRVWVGTEGGGLNCLENGQWIAYRKSPDALPSDNVSALYVDAEGMLWIGTEGGGLARFHEGKWARYTRADGLASNSMGYFIEDKEGYLWMGSNAGLMRSSKQALNAFAERATNFVPCRVFGRSDGLPIGECSSGTQPGPARGPNGRLWFPTINGLASLDPTQLRPNTNPPPVTIESVLVDGRPVSGSILRAGSSDALVIPARKEHLEIGYSSPNLTAPDRARFKYRLEDNQTAWTEAGTATVAHYNQLAPGYYRFRVIACNEDGVWNQAGAMLAFVVQPPFWRTWWFLASVTILLLGSVIGAVHYASTQRLQRQLVQLRQQEALEKERARIARDIHDQLGASLTQVALLGELVETDKDLPEEVEAHAQQISLTARETTRVLDEIVWAVNPANDTLDGLVTYICKYTQEYFSVAGLHYRLDVPGQLPSTPLPPEVRHNVFLACKEAVTNVVRHSKATAVWVRLRLEEKRFVLEIEDNGRGLADLDPDAAQRRNGLKNMRKRLEEIGGRFDLNPAPEGGALARFVVPFG